MQIHQDKKHFVPQEKAFQAINVILPLKPAIIYSISLKVLQMFVEKCYCPPSVKENSLHEFNCFFLALLNCKKNIAKLDLFNWKGNLFDLASFSSS